ncbi:MAG: UDP-3-O-(3-hydroxymyristoyl)glucosamine N-acyltransferase [Acidobacteria bacterium]|nr:UDP-3-O-(3-hydroxymyristoyl)glucosamine N-acyltransferase [Acidobacteriota bacterium]
MKLHQLAEQLGCAFTGDSEVEIRAVAGIESAGPGDLTFLTNPRYRRKLRQTRAAAIIVSQDFEDLPLPTLRSDNPYLTFARALELFYRPPAFPAGIHPTAVISPRARIGRDASIGPYCFLDEDVEVGDRCRLHSFVVIYRGARIGDDFTAHSHAVVREHCRLGQRVTLQNGAIIGCDGFGFARQNDGRYYKIVQSGPVVVEDDVEVQAHSCVDRATVGETRIARGAKLDNLVQVGHASTVGENSLLCAQVGLAGSTRVGTDVILAGQVGVAGHCEIGDGARATAQTGIPNDVPAGQTVSGYPAIYNRLWLKCAVLYARLPELYDELRALREQVDAQKKKKPRSKSKLV